MVNRRIVFPRFRVTYKNVVKYIKDPVNKSKPAGNLLMEVGKIIIAGLTGAGALLLSEVIEKGLMTIPVFAFEIPLLGSLANMLGIFLGAVVADIRIKKGNEVLTLQHQVQAVSEAKLEHAKSTAVHSIYCRHAAVSNMMVYSVENIRTNCTIDESIQDTFDEIDNLFDELED